MQLRVGQLPARAADERLGLDYGPVGPAATGVGGLSQVLRRNPGMLGVGRDGEAPTPDALIMPST
ncbi:6-phospho-beta-glucosidase, partial [Cronobacter sakazakii]